VSDGDAPPPVTLEQGRADELHGGRPERRGRLGLVALLLVALAGAGYAVERYERDRQLDALLAAAEDAERVVSDSRVSLGGMVRYTGALLSRSDLSDGQRAAVLDSLVTDARRFPPRVEAARSAVESVRPLPWDGELADARAAYLERIDTWVALVEASDQDPGALLQERPRTRAVRTAAADALTAAADGRRADQVAEVREVLLR
jgi:hypothetical protein